MSYQKTNFWNGPAFLAGQRISTRFLGQVTYPEDYVPRIESYRQAIDQLPEDAAAPLRASLANCERFLVPGVFSPLRMQGCLNSLLMQMRAAGVQI